MIHIRRDFHRLNMSDPGYRLHPHRLPNPRHRRIKNPTGLIDLLPAWLRPAVRRIPNRNDNLLFTRRFQRIGDIERKGVISTTMSTDVLAVHRDGGLPVHCAEVQQRALSLKRGIQLKRTSIPQFLVVTHPFHHAR